MRNCVMCGRDNARYCESCCQQEVARLRQLLDSYDPDWDRKEEAEQKRLDQLMAEGPQD